MPAALITITTCNRLNEVQKYIWEYIKFCNSEPDFDFLLAQDGDQEDYRSFCNEFSIPMISSNEREGVGLSKNRVLTQFPDYDHYFFIDDDVELYNDLIFKTIIETASELELHHMCITPFLKPDNEFKHNGLRIQQGSKGGGYFNYFSAIGLSKIGGWHDEFAKWKRYGHTEHSMRYVNAGIAEHGFNSILEAVDMLILHDPPHVTSPLNGDANEFSEPEIKILNQKLATYPIMTISKTHFNGFDMTSFPKATDLIQSSKSRYPLLNNAEKKNAYALYYFFLFETQKGFFRRTSFFFKSLFSDPKNIKLKHWIKTKLMRR